MFIRTAVLTLFSLAAVIAPSASAAIVAKRQNTGQATFFQPGLGACGVTNTAADSIVAISATMFDSSAGSNPTSNPLCNKQIKATFNGKSVTATVTDRCTDCAGANDLDFSPAAFSQLADESVGRIQVQWDFA